MSDRTKKILGLVRPTVSNMNLTSESDAALSDNGMRITDIHNLNQPEPDDTNEQLIFSHNEKNIDTEFIDGYADDTIADAKENEKDTFIKDADLIKNNLKLLSRDDPKVNTTKSCEGILTNSNENEADFDSDDDVADPDFQNDTSSDNSENSDNEEGEQVLNKEEEQVLNKGKRKRRNEKGWKRNVTKRLRISGQEYKTANNRIIKAKRLKEACNDRCKLKCRNKINDNIRRKIHLGFWDVNKSIDIKRQYVASNVEQIHVARRRDRTGVRSGKRKFTNKYSFEINGIKISVCKIFFLNTLSISQTFVDTAISKKCAGGLVCTDERGKHIPANKISERVRNSVRNHIMKFPVSESHYSRERTMKKYLGNHLNISKMYKLYVEDCNEIGIERNDIAKEWLYNEIFNTEFNYSFQKPFNDTCDLCDKYTLQLREVSLIEERQDIQESYEKHLNDSSNRYKLKAIDKDRAKANKNEKVVMVDLQKCLPTPDLHNAQSFYSLKLWTFNYTIYDSTLQRSYCMMWDESIAGRGGNEMASCMLKWFTTADISDQINELTIWSDNCPSQNRNAMMIMCYMWLLKLKPTLQIINHKFLLRGHTHLEADSTHSLIERERKKISMFQIMTPWDWQQMIRLCSINKPLNVISLEKEDFKNFKSLYEGNTSPYAIKKKADDGENFLISEVVHLQVRAQNHGILFYKTDFDKEFKSVDLNRGGRRSIFPESLTELTGTNHVSTRKFNDLQKLLKWVPKRFHEFYNTLPHESQENE